MFKPLVDSSSVKLRERVIKSKPNTKEETEMIIIMKPGAPESSIRTVTDLIESNGLTVHLSRGEKVTIIGVVGDKTPLLNKNIDQMRGVDRVVPVTESYKMASRAFHPDPTRVRVGGWEIGPDTLTVIAGPCAVESEEQLISIAREVKAQGAQILRGGAFKPRTSPYSFQGLGLEGLKLLKLAHEETGLATITEVTDENSLEMALDYVDMVQIGARNMQNFQLLKAVGAARLPVLLKRGMSSTIDEWLNAAEYLLSEGNENVVLCERGIRSFEVATRNTLDLSAIVAVKQKTHLPVLADPSHASGVASYVTPLAKAAVACGADGIEVEVHNHPEQALSDGPQALVFKAFSDMMTDLRIYADIEKRSLT